MEGRCEPQTAILTHATTCPVCDVCVILLAAGPSELRTKPLSVSTCSVRSSAPVHCPLSPRWRYPHRLFWAPLLRIMLPNYITDS